ncbi:rhomboid family intramembrane serine protease [Metabacillus litoralis]|uniref:rhomboid family intramembrane serine protease n=1 Tax=Metabacillus litoralis TaxID=152268 RepID=UPI001CFCEAF2|nr:rhomboid family intramembrane serine protease [Metabacillus litoralis]
MDIEQDYFYWSLIEQLVIEQKYTILGLSQDGNEILLEPVRNKQFSIVRLRRMDVDWGNSLSIDIEKAGQKFQSLLNQGVRTPLTIANIYVSTLPPVDDYPDAFENGYTIGKKGAINITSLLLVKDEKDNGLKRVEELLNVPLKDRLEGKETTDNEDVQKIRNRVVAYHNDLREEERKLFQNGKPFFTYIFLIIQIFMFLLLEFYGGSEDTETLIQFGAKFNPYIYEGEWWRFITPIVLHIGFFHLLMNSFALYYIGPAVERAYGSARFLFIYLIAGISGSIASFAFSPFVSAGASGAIFGCFGALLYIGIHNRKAFLRTMGPNLFVIIGINLALGFVIPNIDNAGHIGGLVGGFLAALIVQIPQKKQRLLSIAGVIVAIGLLYGLYQYGMNETENQSPQYTLLKAQELIKAYEYEEAYTYLTQAIQEGNSSPNILFTLSVVEIELGEYDQAIKHLEEITSKDDTFHQAHYNLAILYANEGNLDLALEKVNQALQYDSTNEQYNQLKQKLIQ